jgi:hypothetical protein
MELSGKRWIGQWPPFCVCVVCVLVLGTTDDTISFIVHFCVTSTKRYHCSDSTDSQAADPWCGHGDQALPHRTRRQ